MPELVFPDFPRTIEVRKEFLSDTERINTITRIKRFWDKLAWEYELGETIFPSMLVRLDSYKLDRI